MQQYEVTVLFHPDLEIDLEKPMKKFEDIITSNGGKIVSADNWGKRKLAYRIDKNDYAVYIIYAVEIPGESVSKINNTLNITDEVIRFLIVKPDFKRIAKAEELKKIQEARAKAKADAIATPDDSDKSDSSEK